MPKDDDIVIVGVGCKFPGANNLEEYWRVLSNGENHVKEIPKDRWNIDAFYDADPDAPGKTYVRRAGFVDGIDEFDNRFYGINDEEAKIVDPLQRLVLDCTQMALEDGGITRKDIDKSDTAVYIGCMTDDYKGNVMDDNTIASAYSVTGTHNSIISARVAYVYNLLGAALTIDTACSSSLVAIDVASQALLGGQCKTAICGGVNVLLDPQLFIALSKARMLSPDGQCKTFTNENKGYARGEGCGIVIVKKFKDALADGNKIWGVIKTGTNQDGSIAKPISAPAGEQQRNLIEHLYKKYDVDRSKISVIEAHGTGTPIGDPTEVGALGAYFGKRAGTPSNVLIGSVKTNIGHTEAAAGVAGLIKVLLTMKKQTVVPSLWYSPDNENPKLKLSNLGFKVPTECLPWKTTSSQNVRIACVNSFGFGGTNSHAVVEEYTSNQIKSFSTIEDRLPHRIVTISALDNRNLAQNALALCDSLDKHVNYNLGALSYTSTCKRDHRPVRKAVIGTSLHDIKTSLKGFLNETPSNDSQTPASKSLTFVYCGVGTTWENMCRTLMKLQPFKKAIDEIDGFLVPYTRWKIADKFRHDSKVPSDPLTSHLAIFACQVGLTALWRSYGITPDSVVGQSVGEVAAALAAGFLSLKDAVKISYLRAKLLAHVQKGSMAVVQNISTDHVKEQCKSIGNIVVAVFLSDLSCTVSGDEKSIKDLKEKLKDTNATFIDLDVKCAYHSHFVKEAATKLATELKDIQVLTGDIPMFSSVTGKRETNGLFSTPKYWKENVEKPVVFSTAVKGSAKDKGHVVFLEIGPAPVLRAHIDKILTKDSKYTVLASMKKNDDSKILSETICKLYELGYDLNWEEIVPQVKILMDLPVYQKRKIKNLHISNSSIMRMQGVNNQGNAHPYIRHVRPKDNQPCLKLDVDEATTPFVFEHIVTGFIIIPGATYADVGFDIGITTYAEPLTNLTVSLEFLRLVKVDKGSKCTLDVSTVNQREETLFHVKQGQMTMCKGWVRPQPTHVVTSKRVSVEKLMTRISTDGCKVLNEEDMYSNLQAMKLEYGEYFRMMKKSTTNGVESLTEIVVPDKVMKEIDHTYIHPCILDVMLQSTITSTTDKLLTQIREEKIPFLPIAIGDLCVRQKPTRKMYAYTRRINTTILDTVFQVHYNILLFTSDGSVVADLRNYTTYGKRNQSIAPCELRYRLTWQPMQVQKANTRKPNTLVLTNTFEQSTIEHFQDNDSIVLYQHRGEQNAGYVRDAFTTNTGHFDAVILLVHQFESISEINLATANEIHKLVGHNCMLLTELILYMTEKRIVIPLYVVTQNSQPMFSHDSLHMNLCGEELWGYVRSVHLEFIHGPITMVDVRPSIKDSKESLFNLINATYEDVRELHSELIIDTDLVYSSQFTKDPRREIIPTVRYERKVTPKLAKPHSVMSERSDGSQLAFLAEKDNNEAIKSDYIGVRVKSVCCHPLSMFPRSKEGYKLDPNVWKETVDDGYKLFGLEFCGYITNEKMGRRPTCRSPKVHADVDTFEHECEYVCIWPGQIQTTMMVPKCNIINTKDIGGQYEPGLLLHAAICWSLVDSVRQKASVLVYSSSGNSIQTAMLTAMLKEKKGAYIVDPEASSSLKGKNIDVLISLERIEPSFFLAKYCTRIICLNGCIPECLSTVFERSDSKPVIQSFDLEDMLKKIGKQLSKVGKWLGNFRRQSLFATADLGICSSNEIMDRNGLKLPVRHRLNALFKKSGVYIVTGGLTGLGWEMIKMFAEMGAGVIVTFSRRPLTPQKLIEINDVEADTDCRIISLCADVTDYESLEAGIQEMLKKTENYEVKGVFHGAGVLDAKLLANLKQEQLENVLKPKVIGTMNMHIATRNFDLDYFVVASSINSLIGSLGQSSYGAANAFMDTFMEWRRRRGLPGQAINWGALSVGMASRKEFVENFQSRGFNLLSVLEIRSCLQEALMQNSTSVIYSNIDWDIAAKDYANPSMVRLELQMDVLFQQATSSMIDVENDEAFTMSFDIEALKGVSKDDQVQAVHKLVHVVIARVIGNDTHHIMDNSTFEEIGLDSMSKQTFTSLIRNFAKYQIPTNFMSDPSHTFQDLINHIHAGLFEEVSDK